jgi:hypothetical protein
LDIWAAQAAPSEAAPHHMAASPSSMAAPGTVPRRYQFGCGLETRKPKQQALVK